MRFEKRPQAASTVAASTPTAPAGGPSASQPMAAAVREYVRGYLCRLRSRELATLPIVLGLVVISVAFQNPNQTFLTAQNLSNPLGHGSHVTVSTLAIV